MTKAEKVIKGLECCGSLMDCASCPYDGEDNGCFTILKGDALKLLRERQWVSVKDRLPDPNNVVLTIDKLGFFYMDRVNKNGKWDEQDSSFNPVTHWMPLPEPPKGEENADGA